MKDGFVIRKPTKIHSRSRARRMKEAKRKGRHSGYGMFYYGSCKYFCSNKVKRFTKKKLFLWVSLVMLMSAQFDVRFTFVEIIKVSFTIVIFSVKKCDF